MTRLNFAVFVLWTVVSVAFCQDDEPVVEVVQVVDKDVVRGVVESCSGWRLNRLPEVRSFIFDDVPLFHNVEFERKPGAPPNLYLLNKNDKKVETIDLSPLTREECNQLLLHKGFYKRAHHDEPVPEEFLHGPYKPREEL